MTEVEAGLYARSVLSAVIGVHVCESSKTGSTSSLLPLFRHAEKVWQPASLATPVIYCQHISNGHKLVLKTRIIRMN
jgi:hypothetical protein